MKVLYFDPEYKCHVSPADGLTAFETDFFDGKCDAFIEGYRYIPEGVAWTRPDGEVFTGKMVMPWKSYEELDAAQFRYELEQIARYSNVMSKIEAAIATADVKGTTDTIADARKQAIVSRINDMLAALNTLGVEPDEE